MARQRGRSWIADVRLEDGTRQRPAFATENEANAWEASAKLAVEQGKPLPPLKQARASTSKDLVYLGKVFDHATRTEWVDMKSSEGLIRNAQQVVDYFGRNKRLDEISSADIADMKVHFASIGHAPATVNRRLASISKLFRIAMEAGAIDHRPVMKWNQVAKTRFRYLDDKEERALLAFWHAQGWEAQHDLTMFLIDTGARCWSEALPLKWDALGPNMKTVTFWATKTNKPRTVPLTQRLRDMLAERKKLMPDSDGPFAGVNKNTTTERWKTMRDALPPFKDVTPHTMRHTCCTRLVLGGVDVKRVMEWMGHSAIVTTMRYMQIKPTGLEDVLHVLEGSRAAAA